MLVRVARMNSNNSSQDFEFLGLLPVFFAICDGPASFTEKIIQNFSVFVKHNILYKYWTFALYNGIK